MTVCQMENAELGSWENCLRPWSLLRKQVKSMAIRGTTEHICGRPYKENHCEYLYYANKDEILNGKKLEPYCIYCTSKGKVRKIKNMASWTGLTPKFCPKLKAGEQE